MNQQSEHLSNAQIEEYGSQASGAGLETEAWVEEHLDDCPVCRGRLLEFQRTQLALLPDPDVNTVTTSECPGEDELRQLAAGLSTDNVALKLAAHAATCNHCGPLLRKYIEDFADEFTPEEQSSLTSLESASPAWQQQTAREMLHKAGVISAASGDAASIAGNAAASAAGDTASPAVDAASVAAAQPASARESSGSARKSSAAEPPAKPLRQVFWWKSALVPAATAAAALIAFAIWYTQRDTPEKVEKLLAQAYTANRTLEMRFPGAVHSNYKQTLSGDSESLLNSPDSLRDAANLINSQLKKNPDDPLWLILSARLNLLDWRYKPAFAILDRIADPKVVNSVDVRMTRALALYEQGQWEPERKDQSYGEIINLMGKTLQEKPDDQTALFNRAFACEKLHAYDCAIADYESLLRQKDDEGWSDEVRGHLARIKEKKTPGR